MSKIIIGEAGGRPVSVDLDLLLAGRAMIQAGSGGGKSWLLRLLAERLFGKVPVWIIDPEGEFASLRERFGFVLVGKGGETPADPRSAQLVAHKLLELKASVVFDIFELKPEVRQHFVRTLLEAMVDAPKALWQPLALFMDEAHVFAPESTKAEAYGATVDMATRGRKRGFALIPATQRLAALSKNVTAQLLNRLVGPTFEDVDLERAADLLSILRADRMKFNAEMRVLEPGNFHAVGRAFGPERIVFKVGCVETSHPEVGKSKYSAAPPPAPEKIKALLPKLADLPREAEEKARNEAELRAEIRSLKGQLAAKEKWGSVPKTLAQTKVERVEIPVIPAAQLVRLEKAMANAVAAAGKCADTVDMLRGFSDLIQENVKKIEQRSRRTDPVLTPIPSTGAMAKPQPQPHEAIAQLGLQRALSGGDGGDLTPAKRRILSALAEFEALGRIPIDRKWVAAHAGASHKSSAFQNNLGSLRTAGLITYLSGGMIGLTPQGREVGPKHQKPISNQELLDRCMNLLDPAKQRILRAVHAAYPRSLSRGEIAEQAEASATSSAFQNNLGALRSAGMIEYVDGGAKAADWLFVD